MATAPASAEDHQAQQEALVSLLPALIGQVWPLLDVHDIAGTRARFELAVEAIVRRYGLASAQAALDHYRQVRAAIGVTDPLPALAVPGPVPTSDISQAVGVSLSGLYGPVTPEVERDTLDQVAEHATQLVLDQGRDTVIDVVRQDRAAKGWVRVTEPGACWFCTMLALRAGAGMLYASEQAAGRRANSRFKGGGFDFKVHDNCRCHAEPVFTAYEPSARMREAQATWDAATKGRSGKDAQGAFRQTWEGRRVTDGGPRSVPLAQDPRRIQHLLTLTESLPPSEWRTGELARLRKLLAAA